MQLSPLTREEVRQRFDASAPYECRFERVNNVLVGLHRHRRRLFAQARGEVLDVACGAGANFRYLTGAQSVTAVDFSPAMLELARHRAAALPLTAAVYLMDAEQLDFPDHRFDTVVSALATCSFPDTLAALREMRRVCRPDGRILLLEHGRSRVGAIARLQDRYAPQFYQNNACRWNQEPLELARAAGLRIVSAERALLGILHRIVAAPG
jgi:ubiquinone/menaquinone biosynthesis C-methylase UbiE